jgi:hypothetical protein
VLPALSVAEQVTDLLPNGKNEPLPGQLAGTGPSTSSRAVAGIVTTAPRCVRRAVVSMIGATATTGGVRSTTGAGVTSGRGVGESEGPWSSARGRPSGGAVTVTVNVPVAELPARSRAEHRTVVVPSGNQDPEAGAQAAGTRPSTASAACAAYGTLVPRPSAVRLTAGGSLRTGGFESGG